MRTINVNPLVELTERVLLISGEHTLQVTGMQLFACAQISAVNFVEHIKILQALTNWSESNCRLLLEASRMIYADLHPVTY